MTALSRLHRIFNDALEHDATDRAEFLKEQCGDDLELLVSVQDLLSAHDEDLSMVDQPQPERWMEGDTEKFTGEHQHSSPLRPPESIGPYRLGKELGAGGMGIVYEAFQDQPIKRRVALKLIKPGMDSREVIQRFELERQTLFSLEHPDIARAYDAGVTQEGRPYFVMELVDGAPITRYCDQKPLDLEARLRLFIRLCRAVQYAHLRGIIHRDLKPSNVLVSDDPDGGSGEGDATLNASPKIIDFGIAKAIGQNELSDQANLTGQRLPIGTPETMSPEQARGSSVDIRTDVYSAGVLLYRLLCGEYPFSSKQLRSSDWSTTARVLAESDPQAPSARVRANGQAAPGVETDQMLRRRGRELDWITLRALAKEPERRYQSMEDLAQDVERFLRRDAVFAGPASRWYRVSKFIERNRTAVAAATLVAALVIGSTFALAAQASRLRKALATAEEERTRSEQVSGLLTEIITGADPHATGRNDITALQLLDSGEQRIRSSLAQQPEVLAKLLQLMGSARINLDDLERAEELIEDSITLSREYTDQQQLVLSLSALAELRLSQAQLDEAEEAAREAVAVARSQSSQLALMTALQQLGDILRTKGQLTEAEETLLEAEALSATAQNAPYATVRRIRYNLALVRLRLGKGELALTSLEGLLEAEEEAEAAGTPSGAFINDVRNAIGAQLVEMGRNQDALTYLEDALAGQREVLGRTHSRTLTTLSNVALVAGNLGRLERARDLNLEGLAAMRETVTGPHRTIALMLNNLGLNQHGLGELATAEATFREALSVQRQVVGNDHPNLAFHLSNLGRVLQDGGRNQEAERHYRDALALRLKHLPEDHSNRADTEVWLGALLLETSRAEEAREHLEKAVEIREAKLSEDDWRTAEARSWLGSCLVALGETEAGLQLLAAAYPLIREQRGDGWHRTPAALERLIAGYRDAGDEQAAAQQEALFAERYPSG